MTYTFRHNIASTVSNKQLAILFLAILLIKSILLFVDSKPAYFLGDSQAYLDTPVRHYTPPDRSFVYGFLFGRLGIHLRSMAAVIRFQVLLSVFAAWLVGFYLSRFFGVRFWLASVFSVLCAIEPLQLLMERYFMTESAATFLFAIYFGLILEYVRRGHWLPLVAAQVAGIALLSIRLSFLPDVLLNSVLAPLVSPAALKIWGGSLAKRVSSQSFLRRRDWRVVGLHVVLSVLVSQGLLTGYKHFYGHLMKAKPALLYANGYFLLADLLPMVRLEDYPIASQRQALFTSLKYDPHALNNRLAERWVPDEICDRIDKLWPDDFKGNEIANTTAINAVMRDPAGIVKLTWQEFVSYFDASRFKEYIREDEGSGQSLPVEFVQELGRWFNVHDPKGYEQSITKTWHQAAMPWYWFILCFLLVSPFLLFICRRVDTPRVLVSVAAALLFFGGATLTVERPNARYLTTAAWFVLLMTGIAADRILAMSKRTPARVPSIPGTSRAVDGR